MVPRKSFRPEPFWFRASFFGKDVNMAKKNCRRSMNPDRWRPKFTKCGGGRRLFPSLSKRPMPSPLRLLCHPQRDGPAAHGPRHGRYTAGHPHSLQADAGLLALWIPGVDHAGIATQIKVEEEPEGGPDPLRSWAGKSSWIGSGTGRRSTATALWSSRRSWVLPAIGAGPGSPWTRAAPRPSGRCLCPCTRRASSIRAAVSSTGVLTASRPLSERKWSSG